MMAASPSISEQDEVRELLSQHRDGIVRELRSSRMIIVLLNTEVLTSKERLAICGDDDDTNDPQSSPSAAKSINNGDVDTRTSTAAAPSSSAFDFDTQCTNLIDYVAQNGFEKFKQFCYAIETECPQLIADLINDRLKYGKFKGIKRDRNKRNHQLCVVLPLLSECNINATTHAVKRCNRNHP